LELELWNFGGGSVRKVSFLINFFLVLFCIELAYGAPTISGTNGVVGAHNQVTIQGNGFGGHTLNYAWLGANIEGGQSGAVFSAPGWGATSDGTSMRAPRYTTARSHSGNKSIVSSYTSKAYGSGLWYSFGKEASKMYASYWVYTDLAQMKGQNKMWRIMGVPGNFDDRNTVIMASQWNNNSDYVGLYSTGNAQSFWYCTAENKNGYLYVSGDEIPGFNNWARVEVYFEGGTPGTKNGSVIYKVHKNGKITQTKVNYNKNLMVYNGTSMRAKAFTIQNYLGNAADSNPRTGNEKIYVDDVFVQLDSQARVEIGDKATWSSCTYREVQAPASWTSSQIKVTVNQGTFNTGQTAYVYVVDANGNANSQGYPVKIGSGSAAPTPPPTSTPLTAPKGLHVEQN